MNIKEAAELLGLEAQTLRKQINRGTGYAPCFWKDDAGNWEATELELLTKREELGDISRRKNPRMEAIKIYLSGEDAEKVRKKAQDKSISAFCRWLVLRGVK